MLPPTKTSLHMAARDFIISRWYHRLSAWVHTMPPGFSARCMYSKKGCKGLGCGRGHEGG